MTGLDLMTFNWKMLDVWSRELFGVTDRAALLIAGTSLLGHLVKLQPNMQRQCHSRLLELMGQTPMVLSKRALRVQYCPYDASNYYWHSRWHTTWTRWIYLRYVDLPSPKKFSEGSIWIHRGWAVPCTSLIEKKSPIRLPGLLGVGRWPGIYQYVPIRHDWKPLTFSPLFSVIFILLLLQSLRTWSEAARTRLAFREAKLKILSSSST